ncbi:hypothetical protein DSA05_20165 [Salmonella enterica]|nr:hypothetical protein [Salmonella enterica]EBV5774543.1 hypothetical protein [Salmonella enterica subsp. enterica serovar Monophasic]ECS7596809.1 hypothetical protein [Salmonella enterica subsp. enterica serovar Norwich]EAP1745228.1 hypothetical protein [Salmonella enterica]EAP7942747.1 hypothetical protein [Salmonella enterica]
MRSVFDRGIPRLYKICKVQTPYYRASKIVNHRVLIKMSELLLRTIQMFRKASILDKVLMLIFLLLILAIVKALRAGG